MEINSHTVTLSGGMLRNGYLAIPMAAKHLFPADSLGSRSRTGEANPIELRYGGKSANGDICIMSGRMLAPRRRLGLWFQQELKAKVGDRVRIDRISERTYALTHLPA